MDRADSVRSQSITARLSPYLVAPLQLLVAALLVLRAAGALGISPLADWRTATRFALAIMFVFTAAAHRVIAVTGVLELLGALGLLPTRTAPLAGICLAALL